MSETRTMQSAWGLLVLRCGAASMLFAGHGWDKIAHVAERAAHFPDPLGIGSASSMMFVIFAEGVCSLLVMLGFLTRLASLPIIASMVITAMWVHADDPWSKKEFALLYALPFVSIVLMGPGRFSVDSVRQRRHAPGRRIFRKL